MINIDKIPGSRFLIFYLSSIVCASLYLAGNDLAAKQLTPDSRADGIVIARPLSFLQLAEQHFRKGVDLATRGDNVRAIEQFRLSLNYDDSNPSTVVALAKLYFINKNYTVAIDQLIRSQKMNPNHAGIIAQLAYHYTELQQYDDVVRVLSNRPGSLGGNAKISSLLAYAYIQTKEFNKATDIYRNLLLIHPNGIAWRLGKAIGLEGDGKIDSALLAYANLKSRHSLTSELTHFVNSKIVSLHEQQQSN